MFYDNKKSSFSGVEVKLVEIGNTEVKYSVRVRPGGETNKILPVRGHLEECQRSASLRWCFLPSLCFLTTLRPLSGTPQTCRGEGSQS